MSTCDEIFQEIQKLQREIDELDKSRILFDRLASPKPDPDPIKIEGPDGNEVEIDVEQAFYRMSNDPENVEAWAQRAIGQRAKAAGAEGVFQNVDQLVRELGEYEAQKMLRIFQAATGDWEFYFPKDFEAITSKIDIDKTKELLISSAQQVGVDLNRGTLDRAIAVNLAPFQSILENHTRLQIMRDWSNTTLRVEIKRLTDEIKNTGVSTPRIKQQVLTKWKTAIFAQRALSIAKRRWGQMGKNLQAIGGKDLSKEIDTLYRETGIESKTDLVNNAEEIATSTIADFTSEDSLITKVVQAADRGVDGIKELEEIQAVLKIEGADPTIDLDAQWDATWRRYARASIKDTLFFAFKSQVINNWLQNKVVYAAEGVKSFAATTAELTGAPYRAFTQRNLPEIQGDLFTPHGTAFSRNFLKAVFESGRMHLRGHLVVDSMMKHTVKEIFQENFFEGKTPFGGSIDKVNNQVGMLSLEEQAKVGDSIMETPLRLEDVASLDNNSVVLASYKLHVGVKRFISGLIDKENKLPLFSALQMMQLVDHRIGKRAFLVKRHLDLTLEAARQNPTLKVDQWADIADTKISDELYQATPTKENITAYRKQYGLDKSVSDNDISEAIAMDKVGYPVLSNAAQQAAYSQSYGMRMQEDLPGVGLPGGQAVDNLVSRIRRNEIVDVAAIPVWKTASTSAVYNFILGNPLWSAARVSKAVYHGFKGTLTDDMVRHAYASSFTAAGMMSMFMLLDSQGQVVGNGPPPGTEAYSNWSQKLENEGKQPNSIFGIPWAFGNLPIVSTMFMYKDFMDAGKFATSNKYDRIEILDAFSMVLTGQLMRTPSFKLFHNLFDALNDTSGNAYRTLWETGAFAVSPLFTPSGPLRDLGAITGTSRSDLYRPSGSETPATREYIDKAWGPDHPITIANNWLREITYSMAPQISGLPTKEHTWLGRQIARPDGHIGEWLIGQPGLWHGEGSNKVEMILDQLQLLDPPSEILTQRIGDIPITPELTKLLNYNLGHVTADGYITDQDAAVSAFSDGSPRKILNFTAQQITITGAVQPQTIPLDVTNLLNRVTSGNTLREALAALFESTEWKDWERDSSLSINQETTRARIDQLPGPRVVKILIDFYRAKAIRETIESGHPDADLYRRRLEAAREFEAGQGVQDLPQLFGY